MSVIFLLLAGVCALLVVASGSTVYNGLSFLTVAFLVAAVVVWPRRGARR